MTVSGYDSYYLSTDADNPLLGLGSSGLTTGATTVDVSSATTNGVVYTTFTATIEGGGGDNPTDYQSLDQDQYAKTVAFQYSDVSTIDITFAITAGPDPAKGRNFQFYLINLDPDPICEPTCAKHVYARCLCTANSTVYSYEYGFCPYQRAHEGCPTPSLLEEMTHTFNDWIPGECLWDMEPAGGCHHPHFLLTREGEQLSLPEPDVKTQAGVYSYEVYPDCTVSGQAVMSACGTPLTWYGVDWDGYPFCEEKEALGATQLSYCVPEHECTMCESGYVDCNVACNPSSSETPFIGVDDEGEPLCHFEPEAEVSWLVFYNSLHDELITFYLGWTDGDPLDGVAGEWIAPPFPPSTPSPSPPPFPPSSRQLEEVSSHGTHGRGEGVTLTVKASEHDKTKPSMYKLALEFEFEDGKKLEKKVELKSPAHGDVAGIRMVDVPCAKAMTVTTIPCAVVDGAHKCNFWSSTSKLELPSCSSEQKTAAPAEVPLEARATGVAVPMALLEKPESTLAAKPAFGTQILSLAPGDFRSRELLVTCVVAIAVATVLLLLAAGVWYIVGALTTSSSPRSDELGSPKYVGISKASRPTPLPRVEEEVEPVASRI